MVLVKINTPVHYHVKKYRICKNKICQGPGTLFDGNMVVSAGMAHIIKKNEEGQECRLYTIPFLLPRVAEDLKANWQMVKHSSLADILIATTKT